jgi:hypothetical protein
LPELNDRAIPPGVDISVETFGLEFTVSDGFVADRSARRSCRGDNRAHREYGVRDESRGASTPSTRLARNQLPCRPEDSGRRIL